MANVLIEMAGVQAHNVGQLSPAAAGGAGAGAEEGGFFEDIFGFFTDGMGVLGDVIGFPIGLIAEGSSTILNSLGSAVKEIPLVGQFVSDILTSGQSLLAGGLKLDPTSIGTIGTLLKVFGVLDEEEQKTLQRVSETKIVAKAAETNQAADITQLLALLKKSQGDQKEDKTLKTIAGVGVPVLVGGGLSAALIAELGTAGGIGVGVAATGAGLGLAALLGAFE